MPQGKSVCCIYIVPLVTGTAHFPLFSTVKYFIAKNNLVEKKIKRQYNKIDCINKSSEIIKW